jgi:Reverse transcriptase (RNA-dependent DNA polymerase)
MADIGTACLNATIDKRLVELFPDAYSLTKDGCVYEKRDNGCVESAELWYDEVSSTLLALGFGRNPHDICSYNIDRNGHQMTVCLYVNDLLMTSVDETDIDWLTSELRKKYDTVTLNIGDVHSYLGQTFDFSVQGEVSVSMDGYIRHILNASNMKGCKATPADVDLYDIDASLALAESGDQDDFRSLVMLVQTC